MARSGQKKQRSRKPKRDAPQSCLSATVGTQITARARQDSAAPARVNEKVAVEVNAAPLTEERLFPQVGIGGVVGRAVGWFIAFNAAVWTLIEVGERSLDLPILEAAGIYGMVSFILASALGALLLTTHYLWQAANRNQSNGRLAFAGEQPTDEQLSTTLLEDLGVAFGSEAWEEVLKIGSVLSRPLWVLGKYRLRIEVGRLVEAAAARSGHTVAQATALIDDLG